MQKYVRHFIYILKAFLKKNERKRYTRLNLSENGKVYFYDNLKNCFFHVVVRDRIDSTVADQVFKNNEYDLSFLTRYDELFNKYKTILEKKKKPLIIDCGAHIGLSAFHFATTFPNSIVVAIEPEKKNFSLMLENCKNLKNVELLNSAVGCMDGYVNIINEKAASHAFKTSRKNRINSSIDVVTINSILKKYGDCVAFIVKIDIEGFEDDLFSSNTEWVGKFPLLIIETHDWMLPGQANSHNFLKAISEQRRDFVHRHESIFSISNM
ncbi:FkbM family methyltransferase [Alphaproteobacteria bacterium]|nr:FkbM family methyltransferase [Alphaproteobacteria bacterium]